MKSLFAGLALATLLATNAQADVYQEFYLAPVTLPTNIQGLTGIITEDMTTSRITAEFLTENGETFNSATSTNTTYSGGFPSLLFVLGSAGDLLYTGTNGTNNFFIGQEPFATFSFLPSGGLGGYGVSAVPVPEPASYAMVLAGLMSMTLVARRRARAAL